MFVKLCSQLSSFLLFCSAESVYVIDLCLALNV